MKSIPGPPATLGSSAAAHVRLIVWCRECRHQVEPDAAEQAERYGAEMTVPCRSRQVDMVSGGNPLPLKCRRLP